MSLITAKNISLRLEGNDILQSISLTLHTGELAGLLGPSGCGKSTLVRVLLKMLDPSKGSVTYALASEGTDKSSIQKLFGYVPQDDIVHRSLTVEKAFLYSYMLRMGPGVQKTEAEEKVRSLMETLDLLHRAGTRVKRLSGGERKRVNLGIELLTDPVVLFLDEPTSGLDPHLDQQMMTLFRKLTSAQRSVMVTTHILTHIHLFDVVFFLYKGFLVFGGTPAAALEYFEVTDHELIYTKVRRSKPSQLADRFRKSTYYNDFIHRKPQVLGFQSNHLAVEPSEPIASADSEDRVASGTGSIKQEHKTAVSRAPFKSSKSSIDDGSALASPVVDAIDDELLKLKERLRKSKEQASSEE